MSCPSCGADWVSRSGDAGTARSVCACEKKSQKCAFKKRGSGCGEVVQAEIDPYADPNDPPDRYRCANHVIEELMVEELPKPAVYVPPPPKDPDSRVGMVIEEQSFAARKQEVLASMKGDKHRIRCMDCGDTHTYEKRKLLAEEKGGPWLIVCPNPKCGSPKHQYLD